ncbi:MAG TPA: VWA domain-containing protein, partial [Vicinamibacterales bacterium]|nr:VWA domain-containing protein [Vicinamibacterales bacterium]
MFRRSLTRRSAVGLAVAAALLMRPGAGAQSSPSPQTTPQFRVSTTLVPVDVRVLDRQGQPVADLSETDFTILEDGRRQTVSFFTGRGLEPAEPNPNAITLLRDPRNADVGPQNHRVFLLMLGRGRLQPPAKGVDAMIEFVRDRLLPQDHVGILAWNRATDLTTDHARVLAVLERFKREHERIEGQMRQRFTGLTAVYGGSKIPETVQARIDAVFNGPEQAGTRALPEAQNDNRERLAGEHRRLIDQLMGSSAEAVTGAGEADAFDLGFDDFVEAAAQTNQDISNLYTGIEYLRHLSGEKHLVLVTEQGLQLPRMEDSTSLAAVANDARVVIDTIHTGGLPPSMAAPPNRSLQTSSGSAPFVPPAFSQRQRVADLRTISTLTGGISSTFQYASRGARRIADATSFQYLLGYYPTNTFWNGRYRNIRVQVNRP